jgi:hypothetical protein
MTAQKVTGFWAAFLHGQPKSSRGSQAKLPEAQSNFCLKIHTYLSEDSLMQETCSIASGRGCDSGLRRIEPVISQELSVRSTTEPCALVVGEQQFDGNKKSLTTIYSMSKMRTDVL